ncbi:MAG TPA: response regulator, partial [Gemmatimonadaceae bacterium]|nr:response regulator [Gemmatimonadaceae bacterium]
MSIRVLVTDDEPIARRRIRRFLRAESNVEVIGEASNGREAIEAIRQHNPDLVFLDVQMPDVDGFGVVQALGADQMPAVIFVTAYDEYALK